MRKMRRRMGRGAVVDGCGVWDRIGEFRPCGMGGSVWSDGGGGGRGERGKERHQGEKRKSQ